MNWIMGCISSANFALLINGSSSVFTASRGIRKGCPLSPLLFILVLEGLSLLIKDVKEIGKTRGINISASIALTCLLFVDDVVLFGLSTIEEWMTFEVILDTFCYASGMSINIEKYGFLYNDLGEGVLNRIRHIMPYTVDPIQVGFKYLGYYIKPLGYEVKDWLWFLKKFEKRIKK